MFIQAIYMSENSCIWEKKLLTFVIIVLFLYQTTIWLLSVTSKQKSFIQLAVTLENKKTKKHAYYWANFLRWISDSNVHVTNLTLMCANSCVDTTLSPAFLYANMANFAAWRQDTLTSRSTLLAGCAYRTMELQTGWHVVTSRFT